MRTKTVILVTVLATALGGAWALFGPRWSEQLARYTSPGKVGEHGLKRLPDLRLPDLSGRPYGGELKGQVVVLNFWATWCTPCREEIPLFNAAQAAQGKAGVQFIGIAIDEPEAVKGFAKTTPIDYPVLLGGMEAIDLSRQLGNRLQGLPFTAIFDRDGNLVYAQTGPLTRAMLEERLAAVR